MDLFFFSIIILIISAVAHEISHGYAADWLGDPTPRMQGRLTINPMKHLDPVGSFLLPFITYNVAGFLFGWAKPIEFNPYNLKNPKRDEIIIALAGPLSNLVIATCFGLILKFHEALNISQIGYNLVSVVVIINLALMVFNLIPIPPLDGSKVLLNLIPDKYSRHKDWFVNNSIIFIIFVLFFAGNFVGKVVECLFAIFLN